MDTDGGLYFHKHSIKGKLYLNIGLTYTSYSKPLLQFVYNFLLKLNFHPKLRKKSVNLYQYYEIKKYFDIIGTSNSHIMNRWKEYSKIK